MANKKKNRKRKAPRLGSTIRIRRVKGLGQLNNPRSLTGAVGPTVLGAFATALTVYGLRMMTPKTPGQMKAMEFAPWIGGLVGTVSAMLLGMMSGRPAAWGAGAGSAVVTLALAGSEAAAKMRMASGGVGAIVMEPHASRGHGAGPLGAIVPEYGSSPRTAGLGGLGAYGDQVTLKGVNAAAFGTPGFAQSGRR